MHGKTNCNFSPKSFTEIAKLLSFRINCVTVTEKSSPQSQQKQGLHISIPHSLAKTLHYQRNKGHQNLLIRGNREIHKLILLGLFEPGFTQGITKTVKNLRSLQK